MLSKELVGASARPILLSILARQPSYGYAIMQQMHDLAEGEVDWKDGTLYPVLHRLEDEGLIASFWEQVGETKRRRKYYRLTPAGEAALETEKQQWLRVDAILARLWGLEPRLA